MNDPHAFVDESFRREYILCAAIIDPSAVNEARRMLTALLRSGQRRTHMAKESDSTRKAILRVIGDLDTSVQIVAVEVADRSQRRARDAALKALTSQLVDVRVARLIIESCDQDPQDRQVVGDRLAHLAVLGSMELHHMRPHDEPLLWVPDAIAWAYGKGGSWRKSVDPMISQITRT